MSLRFGSRLLSNRPLNLMATTMLVICFLLVSFVAILGTFINKVAPVY
jgi:hypothetical protein